MGLNMTINMIPVLYSPVICINLDTPGTDSTLPRPTLPETFYYEFLRNGKERPSPTNTLVTWYYKLLYWHRSSTRLKFDSIERSVSLRSFGRSGRARGCEKLPWLEQVFVSFSSSSTQSRRKCRIVMRSFISEHLHDGVLFS